MTYETLSDCINEVILWNTGNMLLCNPGKTEVLHLSSRFKKHQNLQANFSFANTIVQVSDKVVNLGTVLDKNMTLSSHINEMCKKAILNIKSIGRISALRFLNVHKNIIIIIIMIIYYSMLPQGELYKISVFCA